MQVIQWDAAPAVTQGEPESAGEAAQDLRVLVECPYFCIRSGTISGQLVQHHDGSTFSILFIAGGSAGLSWAGEHLALPAGSTALIPAALPEWSVQLRDELAAVVLVTGPA